MIDRHWLTNCEFNFSGESSLVVLCELFILTSLDALKSMQSWDLNLICANLFCSKNLFRRNFVLSNKFNWRIFFKIFILEPQIVSEGNRIFIFVEKMQTDHIQAILNKNMGFRWLLIRVTKKFFGKKISIFWNSFQLIFFVCNITDFDIKTIWKHNVDSTFSCIVRHVLILNCNSLLAFCQLTRKSSILINLTEYCIFYCPFVLLTGDVDLFLWHGTSVIHYKILESKFELASR